MTDQWPKPKSLKDDPPPPDSQILLYNSCEQEWQRSKTPIRGIPPDFTGYTHWLPMPPDPPQPKEAWCDAYEGVCYELQLDPSHASKDRIAFKAGWNAALEVVSKEAGTAKAQLNSLMEQLKAP